MRGLDYYSRTVFEWITDKLGPRALYVPVAGTTAWSSSWGKPVPAGIRDGLERLVAILEEVNPDAAGVAADVYLVLMGEAASREGLVLVEQLRDALPGREVVTHCGGGGMKAQFKRADRSGARYAIVIGDAELEADSVMLKPLRADEPQAAVRRDALIETLQARLS